MRAKCHQCGTVGEVDKDGPWGSGAPFFANTLAGSDEVVCINCCGAMGGTACDVSPAEPLPRDAHGYEL